MCLGAVKYAGAELPKDEHLKEAEVRNKDGIGVSYWKPGSTEVNIKKDFKDVSELISWLKENIKKEDVCLIHFRLATHGLVDVGNRHPFPVTKNKELLRKVELVCQMSAIHNGILNQYGDHKKYSDTQKFILDILAEEDIKNNLDNEKIRKLIGFYLGGDRLAILRNDGTVFLFGEWVKEGDIFYSNSGYKSYILTNSYFDRRKGDSYVTTCEGCGEDKNCKWISDLTDKIQEWLLCKSCRKQYRKGKLTVENFFINMDERDCEDAKWKTVDKQCENCRQWVTENELFPYYQYKLCRKCVEELEHYDKTQGDKN